MIATGVADDSPFTYQPKDFHVGLGLPGMAKLALALLLAAPAVVAVLVWLVVRRLRRAVHSRGRRKNFAPD